MRKIIGLILLLVILMGASCSKKIASEAPQEPELEQIAPGIGRENPDIHAYPPPANPENLNERNGIFDVVEEMPSYPGGDSAMKQFIAENLMYPDSAVKKELQGRVFVEFVVETDSSVNNVKVVKAFDNSCGIEAARVVKLMKWNPGKQRGQVVRVRCILPIIFKLK